jgi:hypothetical protein
MFEATITLTHRFDLINSDYPERLYLNPLWLHWSPGGSCLGPNSERREMTQTDYNPTQPEAVTPSPRENPVNPES